MWQNKDGSLYKEFKFDDFDQAINFINSVADIAIRLNHHPKIENQYDQVNLWLSTHDQGSVVTQKDHGMAKEIDDLISVGKQESGSIDNPSVTYKLYTDGGSRGNPGPSAYGFVLLKDDNSVVKKGSKYIGEITNNQAEYLGLEAGLRCALESGIKNLNVFMDSLLVVNQVNGIYKVKNPELHPINQKVKELASSFDAITFTHVPREMNKEADLLVNQCLDAQQ